MKLRGRLHLFEGYGIELEYMIVDRDTLDVLPVTDRVLEQVAGETVNEVERGPLGWSNELVLHVIELKTNGPVAAAQVVWPSLPAGYGGRSTRCWQP